MAVNRLILPPLAERRIPANVPFRAKLNRDSILGRARSMRLPHLPPREKLRLSGPSALLLAAHHISHDCGAQCERDGPDLECECHFPAPLGLRLSAYITLRRRRCSHKMWVQATARRIPLPARVSSKFKEHTAEKIRKNPAIKLVWLLPFPVTAAP